MGDKFKVSISVIEKGKRAPQWTIDSDLRGEMTLADLLQYTKSSLIIIADTALSEEQALGFDKSPVVVVDNKTGGSVAAVHPLGKIEFIARADMNDIIRETYQSITELSPIKSGQYAAHNFVFLNGTQVASDPASLESWLASEPEFNDKDFVRFVNVQPYARKLERHGIRRGNEGQNIGRRRTTKSRDRNKPGAMILAPNGAYFLTSRRIRSKYKRNSIIKFTFISGTALGISQTGHPTKSNTGEHPFSSNKKKIANRTTFEKGRNGKPGRSYLYPSIIISVQANGVE